MTLNDNASLADTPVVVVDMEIVRANIARLQNRLDALGVANRPHIKTHKIARFAQMQIEAGAIGIACQKLGEAEIMADAGIGDILIPYNLVGSGKLARLAGLVSRCNISVSADSKAVVDGLSTRFDNPGKPLKVLAECDTGAGRCGVQTPEDAVRLARYIADRPGLVFAGLMTYPPMSGTEKVTAWLNAARELVQAAGLDCRIISTGGTPNIAEIHKLGVATEHRAGTYIYNDRSLLAAGACDVHDCALRVHATVVSHPTRDRAVIDAGSKILTSDLLGLDGYGMIVEHPDAAIVALSEEHGMVDLANSSWQPEIGERISIIPNHACVVSNLVDLIWPRDGERLEPVAVDARGCSR